MASDGPTIAGLPKDITVVQGYFVWSGFDGEGRRCSGGIEYPYHENGEDHDYDPLKAIGMLTFAREMLLKGEMDAHTYGDEDEE